MDKKNELERVDETFLKKFLRLVALIIYLIFAAGFTVGFGSKLINCGNLVGEAKVTAVIQCVLILLVTIFIYTKVINKNCRRSMIIMRKFCSYKELKKFLENEDFKELKNCGVEKIYASKLWLKVDGTFIPKNFIAGAYLDTSGHGVYELKFVLINGKEYYYRIGFDKNKIPDTLNSVKSVVAHFQLYDDLYRRDENVFKNLEERYTNKITADTEIEKLINKWTGEFTI